MVGHIPLEDGIGVRIPGRQYERMEVKVELILLWAANF